MKLVLALSALFLAQAGAAHASSYMCLSQDKEYSYEGYGETKKEAQKEAQKDCYRRSDDPSACYSHRCEKQEDAVEENCDEEQSYENNYGRGYRYDRYNNRYNYGRRYSVIPGVL